MNSLGKLILTAGLTLWTSITLHNEAISAQIKEVFEMPAPDKKDGLHKGDTVVIPDGSYTVSHTKKADVSWYGGKFHGRKTASGKVFDKNKMTAAHKTLPFGTKVLLIDEQSKDSVVVEVTDRWPFVKGRELDVSEWAAKQLGNLRFAGHKKLIVKVMKPILEWAKKQWGAT